MKSCQWRGGWAFGVALFAVAVTFFMYFENAAPGGQVVPTGCYHESPPSSGCANCGIAIPRAAALGVEA